MFLHTVKIGKNSLVSDIVAGDYRTAEVFRKYSIGYCCGGKWPLDMACEMQGLDVNMIQSELERATRINQVSNTIDFADCTTEFIIDYIINVHHRYLNNTLLPVREMLSGFIHEHRVRYSYLEELDEQFNSLMHELKISVQQEENVVFPYIRHLAHAHKHKEPYATLLIKTLRMPGLENAFGKNENISGIILSLRKITEGYNPPVKACISHKVVLSRLKELDYDLVNHLNLEQTVLFPRALAMENELLSE